MHAATHLTPLRAVNTADHLVGKERNAQRVLESLVAGTREDIVGKPKLMQITQALKWRGVNHPDADWVHPARGLVKLMIINL